MPTFPWSLTSPSRPLLVYFQNTSACLACAEVVPYVSVCPARLYGQGFIAPVSGSFMLVSFPIIVLNNIGWSELKRISHGAVALCIVANPCLCLDWKCVTCPTANAKGNLDRMECYTNSDLAKMAEIIQTPVRDYDVSFMRYRQTDAWKRRKACCPSCQFLWQHCQTAQQIPVPSMCKALWWDSDIPKVWALLQGSPLVCIQGVYTRTIQGSI